MFRRFNLAVRFGLELCALAGFGYWGAQVGATLALKFTIGIGLPVIAALFWGAFVSPKARFSGPRAVRFLLGLAVLALAAVAIARSGHRSIGLAYGALSLINTLVTYVWEVRSTKNAAAE